MRNVAAGPGCQSAVVMETLAKDGMDLPADQMVEGPSEIQMGNGETYDFAYVPSAAGDFKLDTPQSLPQSAGTRTFTIDLPPTQL
jgi:hypothetical protein